MEINKLNVGQICSVRSFIKLKCHHYEYLKERRFLFWVIQEEGFYTGWYRERAYWTIKEIESKGLLIEGEYVFYKPHIEIKMSDQSTHEKYFETEKELNDFMETEQMKSVVWINKTK